MCKHDSVILLQKKKKPKRNIICWWISRTFQTVIYRHVTYVISLSPLFTHGRMEIILTTPSSHSALQVSLAWQHGSKIPLLKTHCVICTADTELTKLFFSVFRVLTKQYLMKFASLTAPVVSAGNAKANGCKYGTLKADIRSFSVESSREVSCISVECHHAVIS